MPASTPPHPRVLHPLVGLALAGAVLAVGACAAPPEATAGAELEPPIPAAVRLVVGDEPVWRSGPMNSDQLVVVADHLVIGADTNTDLQVIDLTTGRRRWSLEPFADTLGDPDRMTRSLYDIAVTPAAGGLVVVPYLDDCLGCERAINGVAGLSLTNGEGRWFAELWDGTGGSLSGEDVAVVDADAEVVVVTARPTLEGDSTGDEPVAETVVLDATSGEIRWRQPDFAALALAGDRVIGTRVDPADAPDEGPDIAAFAALDTATGDDVWAIDDLPPTRLAGWSREVVVTESPDTGQTYVIAVDDGEWAPLGQPLGFVRCPPSRSDDRLLCAFSQRNSPDRVVALGPEPDDHPDVTDRAPDAGWVTAAGPGVGWLSADPFLTGDDGPDESFAIDVEGLRVSTIVPGTVRAADDHWVVTERLDADRQPYLTAYAIES